MIFNKNIRILIIYIIYIYIYNQDPHCIYSASIRHTRISKELRFFQNFRGGGVLGLGRAPFWFFLCFHRFLQFLFQILDIHRKEKRIHILQIDNFCLQFPARSDSMYTKHSESRQAVVSFLTNYYVMALYKKECFITIIRLILWSYSKFRSRSCELTNSNRLVNVHFYKQVMQWTLLLACNDIYVYY